MIKQILILTVAFIVSAGALRAQQSGTGVGVIVGDPTGVTVKHWIGERQALDAAVGLSFNHHTTLHVHADWLWHDFDTFSVDRGSLPVYIGVGARFKSGRDRHGSDRFGVRVPVGIAYHFDNTPLELFGEVVPILDVSPSTRISLNAAVGVRWYFR